MTGIFSTYATPGHPIRRCARRYSSTIPQGYTASICRNRRPSIMKTMPRSLSKIPASAGKAGADGVIVSNHGGRQLDGSVAPLRVLPGIAAESRDMAVMMDGGIRRGTDVLKALALGADFVFVGRPWLYAAAIAGEDGVRHAVNLLRDEIARNMGMLGITSLDEMQRDRIVPARGAI